MLKFNLNRLVITVLNSLYRLFMVPSCSIPMIPLLDSSDHHLFNRSSPTFNFRLKIFLWKSQKKNIKKNLWIVVSAWSQSTDGYGWPSRTGFGWCPEGFPEGFHHVPISCSHAGVKWLSKWNTSDSGKKESCRFYSPYIHHLITSGDS